MPELPEVETVVRTLRPLLVGKQIHAVYLNRMDILTPPDADLKTNLVGRSVKDVSRRGKRIVISLDDANRFYFHLGMTGRLTFESAKAEVEKHTHLILDIGENGQAGQHQVRFRDPRRFGGVWWLGIKISPDHRMGPEPLTLRTATLKEQLAHTTRSIKTALLDQKVVAGLGNIYVDESLFAAAIHPLIPANQLNDSQIAELNRAIKRILRKAVQHRGSTLRDYRDANGAMGGFQLRHKVYDRAGKPCHVCKAPIERIVLGGRSTHYCANCQKR